MEKEISVSKIKKGIAKIKFAIPFVLLCLLKSIYENILSATVCVILNIPNCKVFPDKHNNLTNLKKVNLNDLSILQ